jgi:hypothetical protein
VDNERVFDLSARVSSEGGNGILSEASWEALIATPDDLDDPSSIMNTVPVRSLLQSEPWKQSEEALSQIFSQVFALDDPQQVLTETSHQDLS